MSTNKKLSELFDLPDNDEPVSSIKLTSDNEPVITTESLTILEKIDAALPSVRGLEASDAEMDELASLAVDSFKELSDLGLQSDSRYASELFGVAGNMLGHAITAKTAKINKKLKMLELQLKTAALQQKSASQNTEEPDSEHSGKLLDRNELLKTISFKNPV